MKDAVDYKMALVSNSGLEINISQGHFFLIASRSEKPKKAKKIVSKRLKVSSFIYPIWCAMITKTIIPTAIYVLFPSRFGSDI